MPLFFRYVITCVALLMTGRVWASTGPIYISIYGYISILLVIPLLILIPPIVLMKKNHNKDPIRTKQVIWLFALCAVCVMLELFLGWLLFNFKYTLPFPLSGREGWWILFGFVIPPYLLILHYSKD